MSRDLTPFIDVLYSIDALKGYLLTNDVNAKLPWGYSILLVACQFQQMDAVNYLIDNTTANVHHRDRDNENAIFKLVQGYNGGTKVKKTKIEHAVLVLIQKGVPVVNENKHGHPILCKSLFGYNHVSYDFRVSMVRMLLENGAYLRVKFCNELQQDQRKMYNELVAQCEVQKRMRLRLWLTFMRQTDIAKVTLGVQQASQDEDQPMEV
jgi:hypothetical protein